MRGGAHGDPGGRGPWPGGPHRRRSVGHGPFRRWAYVQVDRVPHEFPNFSNTVVIVGVTVNPNYTPRSILCQPKLAVAFCCSSASKNPASLTVVMLWTVTALTNLGPKSRLLATPRIPGECHPYACRRGAAACLRH